MRAARAAQAGQALRNKEQKLADMVATAGVHNEDARQAVIAAGKQPSAAALGKMTPQQRCAAPVPAPSFPAIAAMPSAYDLALPFGQSRAVKCAAPDSLGCVCRYEAEGHVKWVESFSTTGQASQSFTSSYASVHTKATRKLVRKDRNPSKKVRCA